jgi:hypothetical protein
MNHKHKFNRWKINEGIVKVITLPFSDLTPSFQAYSKIRNCKCGFVEHKIPKDDDFIIVKPTKILTHA